MINRLKQFRFLILSLVGIICLGACNLNQSEGSRGAIALGNPATIVTETDSQYLEDAVADLDDTEFAEADAALVADKDTFNNVAAAQQLAKQQEQDSVAALKAAEQKEKEAKELKEKEEKKAAADKNKKTTPKEDKKDKKKSRDKKLTAKEKKEQEKKNRQRR